MNSDSRATKHILQHEDLPVEVQENLAGDPELDALESGLLDFLPTLQDGDLVVVVVPWEDAEDGFYVYRQQEGKFYQSLMEGDFTQVIPDGAKVFTDFHPLYWKGLFGYDALWVQASFDRPLQQEDFYLGEVSGQVMLPLRFQEEIYYLVLGDLDQIESWLGKTEKAILITEPAENQTFSTPTEKTFIFADEPAV